MNLDRVSRMKTASCMLGWSTKIGRICFQNKNIFEKKASRGKGRQTNPSWALVSLVGWDLFLTLSLDPILSCLLSMVHQCLRLQRLFWNHTERQLALKQRKTDWLNFVMQGWRFRQKRPSVNLSLMQLRHDQMVQQNPSFTMHWHLMWAHNAPIPTHTHACMLTSHQFQHTHTHVCTHTHTHACIHTHTHTHGDTHTQTVHS